MSLWVTFQQKCEARAAAHRAIASDTPYYSLTMLLVASWAVW